MSSGIVPLYATPFPLLGRVDIRTLPDGSVDADGDFHDPILWYVYLDDGSGSGPYLQIDDFSTFLGAFDTPDGSDFWSVGIGQVTPRALPEPGPGVGMLLGLAVLCAIRGSSRRETTAS